MITQTYNLNLIPEYGSVPVVVHVSQYDSGARTLKFNLLNGDVPFSPSAGSTVIIDGTKPDGHSFSYLCSYSGSQVSADVTLQMCACAGNTRCELRISDSTGILGTANFILCVETAGLSENPDMSDTELPAVIAMATAQMEAARESAQDADASATLAESYAKGGTSSRTGENTDNAKYYSEQSADSAAASAGSASNSADSEANAAASERNAAASEDEAKSAGVRAAASEAAAAGSARDSLSYARLSESWAVGERNGVPVPSSDDTYENNSKYYAGQAASSAETAEGYADDAADIKAEITTMIGQVLFFVNFTTGNLMYTDDNPYTFQINTITGNLEWEVTAA